MSAQADMFPDQVAEVEAAEVDRTGREDWPTPRGVCRAVIESRLDQGRSPMIWWPLPGEPLRVLDFCAGTGPWSSELRQWAKRHGIRIHITAVELHEPHARFARRWADEVIVGDWTLALACDGSFDVLACCEGRGCDDCGGAGWEASPPGPRYYDLIIGNPPFSLVAGSVKRGAESAVPRLLDHAPVVSLLSTSIALSKTETGRAVRRSTPLAHVLELGPISFNGAGADSVPYAMFTWLRGAGSTVSELVRELKPEERSPMVIGEGANKRTIRPGAEPEEIVDAQGWEVVR